MASKDSVSLIREWSFIAWRDEFSWTQGSPSPSSRLGRALCADGPELGYAQVPVASIRQDGDDGPLGHPIRHLERACHGCPARKTDKYPFFLCKKPNYVECLPAGVRTTSPPGASRMSRLSELTHSGMKSLTRYPFAAPIIARAIPVFPEVGSRIVFA